MISQGANIKRELNQRLKFALQDDFQAIKEAVSNYDWRKEGDISHRMIGSVIIIQETELAGACRTVEAACCAESLVLSSCKLSWKNLKDHIEKRLASAHEQQQEH